MAKKKVLLVDDEASFTRIVKLNLEQSGRYEVRVENQAKQALATAREFKPDVVLLDIVMPDMEGSEVARLMQGDQELRDIPMGFLTATVMKEEVGPKGVNIGGYPFLAKPVTNEELMAFIDKLK